MSSLEDLHSRWRGGFVIGVALVLRLLALDSHGLWHDEWLSLHAARGVVQGCLGERGILAAAITQDNGNGIAYFLLLRVWTSVAGTGDFAIRMPSVLAGLAVAYLSLLIATRLFGRLAGTVSGLLAATNPLLVRLSQEARGYALATAFVLLAAWYLLSASNGRRTQLKTLAYGTCVALAILSHYLTVGILAAQWLVFVLTYKGPQARRHALLGGLWASAIIAAWLFGFGGVEGLKWMAQRNAAYAERAARPAPTENFALPATPGNVARGLVQVSAPMWGNMLQGLGWRLSELAPLLIVPSALLLGWLREGRDSKDAPFVWACALMGPFLATALALRSGHVVSFQPLYASFATPFAMMALAVGAVGVGRTCRGCVAALFSLEGAIIVLSLIRVWIDAPSYRPMNPYPALALELRRALDAGANVEFPSALVASRVSLYWCEESALQVGKEAAIRILPKEGRPVFLPIPTDPSTPLPR
jgi:hypothetical protein